MPELAAKLGVSILNPKSVAFFKKLTKQTILERAQQANPPHDILGIMLNSREKELDGEELSGHTITDDHIAETCMQFFLDGHITVALVMKMCCYFLSHNPEVQERAIQEIDEFYAEHGEVNKENDSELKFLEQVQEETLRLSNFAVAARTVTKHWKIPGMSGAVLPVGTRVMCNYG